MNELVDLYSDIDDKRTELLLLLLTGKYCVDAAAILKQFSFFFYN